MKIRFCFVFMCLKKAIYLHVFKGIQKIRQTFIKLIVGWWAKIMLVRHVVCCFVLRLGIFFAVATRGEC